MIKSIYDPSSFDIVLKSLGYSSRINDIIINGGDLSEVYKSVNHFLPEFLSQQAFLVNSNSVPQILDDDISLLDGFLGYCGNFDLDNTYFILDIGHAHLVAISKVMLEKNIEPYFYIPGFINARFHETLKYYSLEYEYKKRNFNMKSSFATLIDIHRLDYREDSYNLDFKCFAKTQDLIKFGIKKVVYLTESPYGEFDIQLLSSKENFLKNYIEEGFEVKGFGIDLRQGYMK